ncbi:MAG: hypothetical protein EZS28_025402 [Streblomastix strix]|uniref:Uncharacterized protein n=1 Tax=Streblomastix strix TaxID=222440 RepID=A0A5J4V9E7_9EUKA|nr:MAG: hypothetical protein EZS28_025402 [Streblomastix strix]
MCLWLCFGGGELRQGDGKEGQDANESGIDEQRIIQTFGVLYECYRNVLSADQERDNSCYFDIKLEQQLKLVQLLEEQLEVDGFYEENDVLSYPESAVRANPKHGIDDICQLKGLLLIRIEFMRNNAPVTVDNKGCLII